MFGSIQRKAHLLHILQQVVLQPLSGGSAAVAIKHRSIHLQARGADAGNGWFAGHMWSLCEELACLVVTTRALWIHWACCAAAWQPEGPRHMQQGPAATKCRCSTHLRHASLQGAISHLQCVAVLVLLAAGGERQGRTGGVGLRHGPVCKLKLMPVLVGIATAGRGIALGGPWRLLSAVCSSRSSCFMGAPLPKTSKQQCSFAQLATAALTARCPCGCGCRHRGS